jgi:hypothetical protein
MARPPLLEIDDDLCNKAESLSAQGLTMDQIADVLGVGERTLYENQAKYPQLAQAIKEGRSKGIATITNALFVSGKAGNLGAQIFYLKNRAGWKDKTEVDQNISGELGGTWNVEIKDAKPTDT